MSARDLGSWPKVWSRYDTRRMRGEPIGPQHRDALIRLLGDERVGATLGGVATPDDGRRAHRADDAALGRARLRLVRRSPIARPGRSSRAAARSRRGWRAGTPSRSAGPSTRSAGVRGWRPSWAPRRSRTRSARSGSTEVVSFTLVGNRASRRVMEKLGFAYARRDRARRPSARALPAQCRERAVDVASVVVEVAGEPQRAAAARGHHAGRARAARPRPPAARRPRRSPSRRGAQPEPVAQPRRQRDVVRVDRLDPDALEQREPGAAPTQFSHAGECRSGGRRAPAAAARRSRRPARPRPRTSPPHAGRARRGARAGR